MRFHLTLLLSCPFSLISLPFVDKIPNSMLNLMAFLFKPLMKLGLGSFQQPFFLISKFSLTDFFCVYGDINKWYHLRACEQLYMFLRKFAFFSLLKKIEPQCSKLLTARFKFLTLCFLFMFLMQFLLAFSVNFINVGRHCPCYSCVHSFSI